jgi:tRNA U34 5-methylaminomethyl-2-thiouridine-forming methyltransferase MnmC
MKDNLQLIQTQDGTNTLYSTTYNQHFHSLIDGALNESLHKHIYPSFQHTDLTQHHLNVLDICFGIGYNTFATIYYILQHNIKTKIIFYSPELDAQLISSLKNFAYPKEFAILKHIIDEISQNRYYKDEQFEINIYIGDARDYITQLQNINIVYQDPFSSDVNKELWTKEYFQDISKILDKKSIITTYSISTSIRLSMSLNDLFIYEHILPNKRKATIATNYKINDKHFKFIDMDKKLINNPQAKPLLDTL